MRTAPEDRADRKDRPQHGENRFDIETISGRRDHLRGRCIRVCCIHREPICHLGAGNGEASAQPVTDT